MRVVLPASLSHGFPMVFPWFSMVFTWFSHGFPMVLSTPNLFSYRPLAIPAALRGWAAHPLGLRVRDDMPNFRKLSGDDT